LAVEAESSSAVPVPLLDLPKSLAVATCLIPELLIANCGIR
jgi:hypothetical protein